MVTSDIIFKYFPDLSEVQKNQFRQLGDLYLFHNERVNLISRKDIQNLYTNHILHSLALAKFCDFLPGNHYMDIGTGGGFPGIPLAILFPKSQFTLVDSIGKKIQVVNDVIAKTEILNATGFHLRAEQMPIKVDTIVARAVAPCIELWNWSTGLWKKKPSFYLLKGGDLAEEINEVLAISPKTKVQMHAISDILGEFEFFETKKVLKIIA
jgi:16S rRNA (guanine527-N7)-methyltransferase